MPCHHPIKHIGVRVYFCISIVFACFCFPTWYLEWINTYGHGIRGWASGFGLSLSPSGCVQPLLVDDHRYHRASCYPLYSRHYHNSWTANPVSNQSGSNAMTLRVLSIAHLKWIIHPTKMFPQAIGIQRARTRIWQTQTGDVHLSAHNFCTPTVPSPWHKSPDHENLAPWGSYFGGRHQLTTYMALGQGPHQGAGPWPIASRTTIYGRLLALNRARSPLPQAPGICAPCCCLATCWLLTLSSRMRCLPPTFFSLFACGYWYCCVSMGMGMGMGST